MPAFHDELQDIASTLVLADPEQGSDLAGLAARIHGVVGRGENDLGDDSRAALAALATAAHEMISEEGVQRTNALQAATRALESLLARLDPARADVAPSPAAPTNAAPKARPSAPRAEDSQLVLEFVTEAQEHLASAEAGLLALESDPGDADSLNAVFRSFHTIKGVAGFLDLSEIGSLAHAAENLLDLARQKRVEFVGARVDVTLESLDVMRELVAGLSASLATGAADDPHPRLPALLARLATQARAEPPAQETTAATAAAQAPATASATTLAPSPAPRAVPSPAQPLAKAAVPARVESTPAPALGFTILNDGPADRPAPATDDGRRAHEAHASHPVDAAASNESVPAREDSGGAAGARRGNAGASHGNGNSQGDGTVKVATSRLDSLINMVGELLTARLMVQQEAAGLSNTRPRLVKNISHLAKISRELQDLSMSMRMVPIQGVFQKMGRIVRDVARKAGKEVEFDVVGGETELDRNLVEAISDPLVHMVRNAADHGIEGPDERRRAGKPRAGRIELRAFHQAGNVVIQIVDDGRGLNRARILKKAVDAGLVQNPDELSDTQVWALIFHAGLSTAEKVTDISGRGVGMDVVKRNVEALRGRIDIESTPGRGSVFTIRLPLTLAMIDAMVVKVGASRYIVPMSSIERTIRPRAEQLSTVRGKGEMCLVRGALLPLFRLHRLFGVEPRFADATEALGVLVQAGDRRCCVLVDELLGIQQVIIKSLGEDIAPIQGICGGAILGDGCVSLIVDVPGLVDLATNGNDNTPKNLSSVLS